MNIHTLWAVVLALFAGSSAATMIPIKELVDIEGIRDNQLIGYGLIVGLAGTGEKTEYTQQTFKTMLKNFGINLPPSLKPKLKNVAVVAVHGIMPAFIKVGQKIDITVSSLGEAKSIRGGSLLQTFMKGVDGQVYAIAQGSVIVGGLSSDNSDGSHGLGDNPTVGRIMNGAIVEREVQSPFETTDHITFNLKYPDFSTSKRLAKVINDLLGPGMAHATDATSVKIAAPRDSNERVKFIARIQNLKIEPKMDTSKIIINSHTGTIVVGSEVQLLPVAITHGTMTLTIRPETQIDEPELLDDNNEDAEPDRIEHMFMFNAGTTLNELVKAVNDVGAAPSDVLAILEALKQAGALYGDLIVI